MKRILPTFILLFFLSHLVSFSQVYSWLAYDSFKNEVTETDVPQKKNKYATLLLKNYTKKELVLKVKEGTTLFLNNRFHKAYYQDSEVNINLSELGLKKEQCFYLITMYHEKATFFTHPFLNDSGVAVSYTHLTLPTTSRV